MPFQRGKQVCSDNVGPGYREFETACKRPGCRRHGQVWDVCDQVCGNLFEKTPYAYQKAKEWCQREREFVRRAGFVLMAELAVHDKRAQDEGFIQFFPLIKRYAGDERNFVKKAVNWALRQIGKRNGRLSFGMRV